MVIWPYALYGPLELVVGAPTLLLFDNNPQTIYIKI